MNLTEVGPITVAGYEYPVIYDTKALIDKILFAEIDHHATVIRLRDDVTAQVQLQSLVHEITHAIEQTYLEGVSLDERVIAGFSQGWFQVLRDSPELLKAFEELDSIRMEGTDERE